MRHSANLLILTLGSAGLLAGCDSDDADVADVADLRGEAMGTTWRIVVPQVPSSARQGLRRKLAARLEFVEQQMSHWRDNSIVSRFNRSRSTAPIPIPSELTEVIAEAQRTWQLSDGAFDITAAPLVNLWGFGPDGRTEAPSPEQIAEARRAVGSDRLRLVEMDDGSFHLSKTAPQLQLDLSALAKGYAIDQLAELLDARQHNDYLIEVGGEVRARGRNASGAPWRVGLEHPDPGSVGHVRTAIALRDLAVATSGSYRNFVQPPGADARGYAHIIDPRTGRPAAHDLVSVSVVAKTAMRADAWATALMVLGPEQGFEAAARQNLAATFVTQSTQGWTERSTPAFQALAP